MTDDLARHPGSEDEVGAGPVRPVHDLMGVRRARRPTGRVAGAERVGAVRLDHGRLSRDDIEEPVFLLVPVAPGRTRPGLERLDVRAELGQSARVGGAQPLGGSVVLRPCLGFRVRRRVRADLGEPNGAPRCAGAVVDPGCILSSGPPATNCLTCRRAGRPRRARWPGSVRGVACPGYRGRHLALTRRSRQARPARPRAVTAPRRRRSRAGVLRMRCRG